MTFEHWLILVSACLVISISPGPGALISMRQGIRFGPIFSLYTVLGLQVGVCIQIVVIFFGIGAIIIASPMLLTAITILGVVYLAALGSIQIITAKQQSIVFTTLGGAKQDAPSKLKAFLNAVMIDSTNIKGMIFFLALFSQFISSHTSYEEYPIVALTVVVIDASIMFGYAYFASRLHGILSSPRKMQVFNIISGSLFILLALLLLIK